MRLIILCWVGLVCYSSCKEPSLPNINEHKDCFVRGNTRVVEDKVNTDGGYSYEVRHPDCNGGGEITKIYVKDSVVVAREFISASKNTGRTLRWKEEGGDIGKNQDAAFPPITREALLNHIRARTLPDSLEVYSISIDYIEAEGGEVYE